LIRAIPTAFGARKISRSGQHRQPSAYAKFVDPGNTRNLRLTQNPLIRATPATFGVREIPLIRATPATFEIRESVGAGLLANAVSQTTNTLQQNHLRGQARSYS
jgi:hypothetical protein